MVQGKIFALLMSGLLGLAYSVSVQASSERLSGPMVVLEDIKNSYIIVFNNSVSGHEVDRLANSMAAEQGAGMRHVYRTAIRGFSANMSAQAAERMAGNARVAYVEKDGLVSLIAKPVNKKPRPSDPPESQTIPWGIERVGGSANGSGLTAWILDTGIDLDHGDLNVDVARSANFVARGKNSPDDGHGHGTHVAGTIAALNNEQDVVGVAAGASVVAVRVLDNSGSGSISGVVAGIDYVALNAGADDVANMSLTGTGHFQSLHDAVVNASNAGVLFALAAGNSASDAEDYEPAHVNGSNVFTVSAIDINDVFASFSNFGNPPVDFAAPGVSVLSTKKGGGTTTFSGTSMAAPHVAGLLLLYGAPSADGAALGDPDGVADPIAYKP